MSDQPKGHYIETIPGMDPPVDEARYDGGDTREFVWLSLGWFGGIACTALGASVAGVVLVGVMLALMVLSIRWGHRG